VKFREVKDASQTKPRQSEERRKTPLGLTPPGKAASPYTHCGKGK